MRWWRKPAHTASRCDMSLATSSIASRGRAFTRGGRRRRDAAPVGSLEAFTATLDPPPLLVVLDEVEDPQNVGAILRTMDAVGATGLVRQTRRAAPLDGAAAKASAGAVHYVPVADVVNIARSLETLKQAGVWTVGLDAGAEMAYYEWDLTQRARSWERKGTGCAARAGAV